MENTFHEFKLRIFPYANAIIVCLYIFFILFWIAHILANVKMSTEVSSFTFVFLLGCIPIAYTVSVLNSLGTVKISQDGISGFNAWGGITRRVFIRWDEIEKIKPVRFFGASYLRLFYKSKKLPLWIPLFLKNVNEFQKFVMQYSIDGNVFREYVAENKISAPADLRKNILRFVVVLVVPFIIYVAGILIYFSKAPIDDLVWRSSLSENVFQAIPIPTLPPSFCRFYIRNFADFDIEKRYNKRPLLHWALLSYEWGDPDKRLAMLDLCDFFISKGADINALDEWGKTCLHEAVWLNSIEMVRFLLERGANVNVRAGGELKNFTPLAYAKSLERESPKTNRKELINLLIRLGAVK